MTADQLRQHFELRLLSSHYDRTGVPATGALTLRSADGTYDHVSTEMAWWGFREGIALQLRGLTSEEVSETGPQTTSTHHGQTEVEPEAAPHRHVWSRNEYQLVQVCWDEVKGTHQVHGPSVKVCFSCGEIRLSDSEVRK